MFHLTYLIQQHLKTLSYSSTIFAFLNHSFFSCSGIEIATSIATSLPSSSVVYFIINSTDLADNLSALDKMVFIINNVRIIKMTISKCFTKRCLKCFLKNWTMWALLILLKSFVFLLKCCIVNFNVNTTEHIEQDTENWLLLSTSRLFLRWIFHLFTQLQ